jgi:hypothetical protein
MILKYLWGWAVCQNHGSCPAWGRREVVRESSCGFATQEYWEKKNICDKQHRSLKSQCCAHLRNKALMLESGVHTEARER